MQRCRSLRLALVERLFAPSEEELPLPANLDLAFPSYPTRAQLKRFLALGDPVPQPAAAETLAPMLGWVRQAELSMAQAGG